MKEYLGKLIWVFILAFLLLPQLAFSLELQQAKDHGLVGETPSGYLAIVQPPGSPEAKQLVASTNAERKQKYQEIAKRNGTDLKVVETLAGTKAVELTAGGHYYMTPQGKWVKK